MIIGSRPVILRRYVGAVTYDGNGEPVRPSATDAPLLASVQPAEGRVLETLPEGDRSKDVRLVMSYKEIRTGSQHDGTAADEIVIDGARFQVRIVKRYDAILPHYEAVCVRVDEGAA